MYEIGTRVRYSLRGVRDEQEGRVLSQEGRTVYIRNEYGELHKVKVPHVRISHPSRVILSKQQAKNKVCQRRRKWADLKDRQWKAGNAKPCVTFEPRY